jgi:hypothetical protein
VGSSDWVGDAELRAIEEARCWLLGDLKKEAEAIFVTLKISTERNII